jgi:hypothetical protein
MSFTLVWRVEARDEYERLRGEAARAFERAGGKSSKSKTAGLFKQLHKCVMLLAENPRHPGLQTHVFSGLEHPYEKGGKVFEAYVQNRTPGAYRVFWCYGRGKGEITAIAITGHP